MSAARGTYQNGRVSLDAPVDWVEGARVTVCPADEPLGLSEADWPDTPEARERLLALWEAIEPLEMTSEDEREIQAAFDDVARVTLAAVRKKMGLAP